MGGCESPDVCKQQMQMPPRLALPRIPPVKRLFKRIGRDVHGMWSNDFCPCFRCTPSSWGKHPCKGQEPMQPQHVHV